MSKSEKKFKKQIYLGFRPDGSQIRKWVYGKTEADLQRNIQNARIEAGKILNPTGMSFKEFSERWFEIYKAGRSGKTREMYQSALSKCSGLDPYPVAKITRSMCQQIISRSWDHPRTAKIVADTLKQIFRVAMADGMIAMNPAEALSLPKKPKSRFHLLTDAELEAVEKAELSDQDRLFVTILRIFGLRPAEALALQPTDFDWKRGVLRISKSVELTSDNQSRIKETKTGVSREIPIPLSAASNLKKMIRKSSGFLIFQKESGGLYTKSAYRCMSDRILKAINIALGGSRAINLIPEVTLYSFRHRRATELYYLTQSADPGKRISTKKAAELMGHSEIVFLQTYSHIDESREAADVYSNVQNL